MILVLFTWSGMLLAIRSRVFSSSWFTDMFSESMVVEKGFELFMQIEILVFCLSDFVA